MSEIFRHSFDPAKGVACRASDAQPVPDFPLQLTLQPRINSADTARDSESASARALGG